MAGRLSFDSFELWALYICILCSRNFLIRTRAQASSSLCHRGAGSAVIWRRSIRETAPTRIIDYLRVLCQHKYMQCQPAPRLLRRPRRSLSCSNPRFAMSRSPADCPYR